MNKRLIDELWFPFEGTLKHHIRTSNINWLCDQVGIDFWFESNDQLRDHFNKEFKR